MHRGAGAYICGEETALIESLEGERGMPRLKPPFPAIAGLYAKPTVVNNVETLSTVPHIVAMGGAAYAEIGVNKSTGTRIVAISGHVKKPGNYEIEFGCTFRDVIYGFAGGIRDGHELKFFLPGGASFQWLVNQRRAPRRDLRHRLRAAEPRHDARLGRGDGVRRLDRSAAGRVAAREVLRARVVRQVHAVP